MRLIRKFGSREFYDYFGRDHSKDIRAFDGRRYFIKRDGRINARKDYLAYLLSRDTFNVPEVVLPDDEMREKLALDGDFHLIRLCQDYSVGLLPIRDLTDAIAAELVFSIWIRRRDAHNFNRVFVDGVPMFFDFGAALELQPDAADLDFFRGGPDSGYVGNWRLWPIPEQYVVRTSDIRSFEVGKPLTLHPVHNLQAFWAAAEKYVRIIQGYADVAIERAINACAFDASDADKLLSDLIQGRNAVADGLWQTRHFMTSVDPWPARSGQPLRQFLGRLAGGFSK